MISDTFHRFQNIFALLDSETSSREGEKKGGKGRGKKTGGEGEREAGTYTQRGVILETFHS